MHTSVHCSTIYNSQDTEATQMPINKGMDKGDVAHIYYGISLSYIRNETVSFAEMWMALETVI